jgi:DNA-binding MarR family transcriptional regulator
MLAQQKLSPDIAFRQLIGKNPAVSKAATRARRAGVDYQALAEFRYQIRKFLTFSQQAARGAGVDPQQHQLLLAIRGLPKALEPSIRALAERLQVRHHSAVELIDRCATRGLVERQRDSRDRRQVTIRLTPKGERLLGQLSLHHREELRRAGRELTRVLRSIIAGSDGSSRRASKSPRRR